MLGLRVAVIGGSEEVNEQAQASLRQMYPGIDVDGWSPFGFDADDAVSREMVQRLEAMKP